MFEPEDICTYLQEIKTNLEFPQKIQSHFFNNKEPMISL